MSNSNHHPLGAFTFVATDETETDRFGRLLGDILEAGAVLALVGELGAGKTRLVQAVAAALGVDRRWVTSPTFVLIQQYFGRLPIYHFDTYRLGDPDEFWELGAEEILHSGGVCIIEWADRVEELLPTDRLTITIEAMGETRRQFQLTAGGSHSEHLLQELRQRLEPNRR